MGFRGLFQWQLEGSKTNNFRALFFDQPQTPFLLDMWLSRNENPHNLMRKMQAGTLGFTGAGWDWIRQLRGQDMLYATQLRFSCSLPSP